MGDDTRILSLGGLEVLCVCDLWLYNVCVCVCMYVYTYIYIYECNVCVYIYVCIYTVFITMYNIEIQCWMTG